MKKENIQSRNRKLSAKARKKHSSFASVPGGPSSLDMLKPLEKAAMYGYGMAAAGMPGMAGAMTAGGMTAAGLTAASPYSYMTAAVGQQASSMASMAAAHANNAHAMSAAAAAGFGSAAAAGAMHHAMAPGGFGAAAASSFGSMVSQIYTSTNFCECLVWALSQVNSLNTLPNLTYGISA